MDGKSRKINNRGGARPNAGGRRAGAGRPKGARNKDWPSVRAILGKMGFNPAECMAKLARSESTPPATRARCAAELARYLWPQLSAVQVSGPDGKPIQTEDVGRSEVVAARARLAALLANRTTAPSLPPTDPVAPP